MSAERRYGYTGHMTVSRSKQEAGTGRSSKRLLGFRGSG